MSTNRETKMQKEKQKYKLKWCEKETEKYKLKWIFHIFYSIPKWIVMKKRTNRQINNWARKLWFVCSRNHWFVAIIRFCKAAISLVANISEFLMQTNKTIQRHANIRLLGNSFFVSRIFNYLVSFENLVSLEFSEHKNREKLTAKSRL